jgi:hypothetical protein
MGVVRQGHRMEMAAAHQARHNKMDKAMGVVRQGHRMEMAAAHLARPQGPC